MPKNESSTARGTTSPWLFRNPRVERYGGATVVLDFAQHGYRRRGIVLVGGCRQSLSSNGGENSSYRFNYYNKTNNSNNSSSSNGNSDNHVLSSVEWFDPSISNWNGLPDLNIPRYYCAAAASPLDGSLYCFGGFDRHHRIQNTIEHWSFDANHGWEILETRMQPALTLFAAVALPLSSSVDASNNNNNSQNSLLDVSNKSSSTSSSFVPDGVILLIGGRDGAFQPVDTVFAFHVGTAEISSVKSLPVALFGCAAVAVSPNHVMVVGGHDGAAYRSECYRYDRTANTWTTIVPSLPHATAFASATILQNSAGGSHSSSNEQSSSTDTRMIVLAGGRNETGRHQSIHLYPLVSNKPPAGAIEPPTWITHEKTLDQPREHFTLAPMETSAGVAFAAFGGITGDDRSKAFGNSGPARSSHPQSNGGSAAAAASGTRQASTRYLSWDDSKSVSSNLHFHHNSDAVSVKTEKTSYSRPSTSTNYRSSSGAPVVPPSLLSPPAAASPSNNNNNSTSVLVIPHSEIHNTKNEDANANATHTTTSLTMVSMPEHSDLSNNLHNGVGGNSGTANGGGNSGLRDGNRFVKDRTLRDGKGRSITYSGTTNEAGLPHGFGECTYNSHNRPQSETQAYKGEWKDGLRHGRGKTTYRDGNWYEGEYVFEQRSYGKFYSKEEAFTYEGPFVRNTFNGTGVLEWEDGSFYKGAFKNGYREDTNGHMETRDGPRTEVYDGGFHKGRYNGYGTLDKGNGLTYVGYFKSGRANGSGVLKKDGVPKLDGKWFNDEYVGPL